MYYDTNNQNIFKKYTKIFIMTTKIFYLRQFILK